MQKSIFIPTEQQRIFSDWKEATNDDLTLQEAGITKKSKISILEKRQLINSPENMVSVSVEYNDEKDEIEINKEQYFVDLVVTFFQVLYLFGFLCRIECLLKEWMISN